jgi:hypothetical protein
MQIELEDLRRALFHNYNTYMVDGELARFMHAFDARYKRHGIIFRVEVKKGGFKKP